LKLLAKEGQQAVTNQTVPFNDLGRGTTALRSELDVAISRVVSSGWYVLGPEHDAFEAELASYVGVAHCVAVGNGTDELQIALSALGVAAGDVVLTAANAGGYTTTAARSLGAIPIYADVDPQSLLLTAATLEVAVAHLPTQPKVVVVTHLFGAAAEVQEIVNWAHARGIKVVEDCAQSLGAFAGAVRAGSVGDIATTSFYPTKNLGALGDGGAVLTANAEIATRVRQLRQYGWESKYRTTVDGGRNSRLDELQAAILRVKLPYLDAWNERRRAVHSIYERAASGGARFVNTSGPGFVAHLAVIRTDDRARAQDIFVRHGVRTDVHYPIADHHQPIANDSGLSLAVTENAAQQILSVPLFPELTDDEIARVSMAIQEI
jgi:aminotransferase EvaB